MSDPGRHDALLELGQQQLSFGNLPGAIDAFTRLLAEDPEHVFAHALLALTLVQQKRLHAAQHEARLALALDPDHPLPHVVLGQVAILGRKWKDAEDHLNTALTLAPGLPGTLRILSSLRLMQRRRPEAKALLEQALAEDPTDPDTLSQLGEVLRLEGRLSEAERTARESLEHAPEHQASLVLMGRILLQRGQVEQARDHAIWALRQNPSDVDTLHFLAEVKARTSPLLGLWWRYSVFMQRIGETRQLLVLLGAWVLQRVGTLAAADSGLPNVASAVSILWIALVAYSWFGPTWFEKSVRRELEPVRLRS